MQSTLEVTDLFRSAFFLCMGGQLEQVRIRNNGRRIASFLITGADLDRLDSDYRSGRALVNPVQLRESLNHLLGELGWGTGVRGTGVGPR